MKLRKIPWADHAFRAVTSIAFFLTSYALLDASTFAVRMRRDFPAALGTVHGADALAVMIAAALAILPLLAGRRYLGVLVAGAFVVCGIAAYWWTTVPWDDLVTRSTFPAGRAPGIMDYAMLATPVVLVITYAALSNAASLPATMRARGVDRSEARAAAAQSFLAGAGALVVSLALAGILVVALAQGWLFVAHPVVGAPAVLLALALVALLWVAPAMLRRWRSRKATERIAPQIPRRAAGRVS